MSYYSVTAMMQNRSTFVPPAAAQRQNVGQMQGREVTRQLNDGGRFVNGFVANAVMIAITQPFFALKTYAMAKNPGLPPLSALYKGLGVGVASGGPAEGITFLTYHLGSEWLRRGAPLSDRDNLIASLVSGGLGAIVISPCERVMIQQQLHGGSIWSVARSLIQKEGAFKALTKGLTPTVSRDGAYNTGIFAFNDIVRRELKPFISDKQTREVAASGVAGTVVGALSTPFDLVKTRMQADTNGEHTSVLQTARGIIGQGGVRRLFQGAGPRAATIAIATYCIATSKDAAPLYFPDVCF